MNEYDIRLEKVLDMIIEQAASEIGVEAAKDCPTLIMLYETKEQLRETNNYELAIELGVRAAGGRRCPRSCSARRD